MFTVLVEIVPPAIRSVCIGSFLFLMNNVGGNLPLLIDPLTKVVQAVVQNRRTELFCVQVPGVGLQTALYITWPGLTAASMLGRNLLVNWTLNFQADFCSSWPVFLCGASGGGNK